MKSLIPAALLAATCLCISCGGDDDDETQGTAGTSGSGGTQNVGGDDDSARAGSEAGGTEGSGGQAPPLYAIESLLFGMQEGDSSTSYVMLLDSLDRTEEVSLDDGREFPGYAPLDSVDGKLYAGSGE
ncbi:MAG TPA: hypothetical protein VEQ58_02810, partial [Polyangiaceae bacterium]|nr:hypothetical protein [Polyangiaceae bacterium]